MIKMAAVPKNADNHNNKDDNVVLIYACSTYIGKQEQ